MPKTSRLDKRINTSTFAGRRYHLWLSEMQAEHGPGLSKLAVEQLQRGAMLLVLAEQLRLRAMEGKSVNLTQLLQLEGAADRVLASVRKPKRKAMDSVS